MKQLKHINSFQDKNQAKNEDYARTTVYLTEEILPDMAIKYKPSKRS